MLRTPVQRTGPRSGSHAQRQAGLLQRHAPCLVAPARQRLTRRSMVIHASASQGDAESQPGFKQGLFGSIAK